MRRHIRAALAILTAAVVGLGATSCTSSPDAGNPADPGKGGGMDGAVNAPNGDPRVTSLLRSGIQQARQKHWATATTTFHSVLSIDPRNLYALYDLGVIAQTKTDAALALSYYDKALASDGTYTPAMYNKAIVLENSQPRQAIAMYNQITAIDPQASSAYLRMAFVEAELGDLAQARVADAKAVAIEPSLAKYHLPAKQRGAMRLG
jgi:tetratricopeptide (TPR) repeat protein